MKGIETDIEEVFLYLSMFTIYKKPPTQNVILVSAYAFEQINVESGSYNIT